ncbi:hypothetical protein XACM_3941 [Xanthomonas euvesicatoria pv. citrumelo F1]|nr:hypothetical protein XACM_3941 [Xanthomonas euvesicatoria pv. citrumelo F1]
MTIPQARSRRLQRHLAFATLTHALKRQCVYRSAMAFASPVR